jgi:hypothetical protein
MPEYLIATFTLISDHVADWPVTHFYFLNGKVRKVKKQFTNTGVKTGN